MTFVRNFKWQLEKALTLRYIYKRNLYLLDGILVCTCGFIYELKKSFATMRIHLVNWVIYLSWRLEYLRFLGSFWLSPYIVEIFTGRKSSNFQIASIKKILSSPDSPMLGL